MILSRDGLPPFSKAEIGRSFLEEDLPLPIGATLGGFTLVEIIGVGHRGAVYKANSEGRFFALKVLREGEKLDPEILLRFKRRENRMDNPGIIQHSNLVSVEEVGESGGLEYYARTLLRGDSIAVLLSDLVLGRPEKPHLSPLAPRLDGSSRPGFYQHLVTLFAEVADGLQRAHNSGQSIIHGRIHPGNLIFSPSGRLVLCDFEGIDFEGVVSGQGNYQIGSHRGGVDGVFLPRSSSRKRTQDSGNTNQSDYLAPEQLCAISSGNKIPFNVQTDVFSLASVLFKLVYRQSPQEFSKSSPSTCNGDARTTSNDTGKSELSDIEDQKIANDLKEVLFKSIAADPIDRYQTAKSFSEDLYRLVQLKPTVASLKTPAEYEHEVILLQERIPVSREMSNEQLELAPQVARYSDKLAPQVARYSNQLSPSPRSLLLTEQPLRVLSRLKNKKLIFAVSVIIFLLVSSVWSILYLHEQSEKYRTLHGESKLRSEQLDQGIQNLNVAISAMSYEKDSTAAEALSTAQDHIGAHSVLEIVEKKLRFRSSDPAMAGLLHPHAAIRLDSLETLEIEIQNGKRPDMDFQEVVSCLWDENVLVRNKAISLCGTSTFIDHILDAFPIGEEKTSLRLDSKTFLEIYKALAHAAIEGHKKAREVLFSIEFDALERIDRASYRSESTAIFNDEAVAAVLVPPNLIIDFPGSSLQWDSSNYLAPEGYINIADDANLSVGGFVKEWMISRSHLRGEDLFLQIKFLQAQEELLPELVFSLERIGSPRAIQTLHQLLRKKFLNLSSEILDSMSRLGAFENLLNITFEPFPSPILSRALEKAISVARLTDQERISTIMITHPQPQIRQLALEGLSRKNYFSRNGQSLLTTLNDPALRVSTLKLLEEEPQKDAVPLLLDLLDSSQAQLRILVVRALASSEDPSALFPLAKQLFETDSQIREESFKALRKLRDDRSLPLAVGILGASYPGMIEFLRDVLALPEDRRKEKLQTLIMAVQEVLDLNHPMGESLGIDDLRRALFLTPLGMQNFDQLDRRLPDRIRKIVEQRF